MLGPVGLDDLHRLPAQLRGELQDLREIGLASRDLLAGRRDGVDDARFDRREGVALILHGTLHALRALRNGL